MASAKRSKASAADSGEAKKSGNTAARDMRLVERLKLEQRIVGLRRSGYTWQMIAEELGYKTPSAPFKIWQKAYERLLAEANETVDEQRWNEIGRLEAIMRGGLYNRAQRGDLQAIDRFLRVQEAIRALRGLDAPKAQHIDIGSPLAGAGPAEVARRVRELFSDRAAVRLGDDAPNTSRAEGDRDVPEGPATE